MTGNDPQFNSIEFTIISAGDGYGRNRAEIK